MNGMPSNPARLLAHLQSREAGRKAAPTAKFLSSELSLHLGDTEAGLAWLCRNRYLARCRAGTYRLTSDGKAWRPTCTR